MNLPNIDFSKFSQPLKLLLEGNQDTWSSMLSVVGDLNPDQLIYKYPNYNQRSISEMVNHALDTQFGFYTKNLILGQKESEPLFYNLAKTADEAQKRIIDTYIKTIDLWTGLNDEVFNKEIMTEWGQVLTGELTLFQSITHTHYHVSEICFLRGLGGFSTTVMG